RIQVRDRHRDLAEHLRQRLRPKPLPGLGDPARRRIPHLVPAPPAPQRLRQPGGDLLIVIVREQRQRHHQIHHHLRRQPPPLPAGAGCPPPRPPPSRAAAPASSTTPRGPDEANPPSEIQPVSAPPQATPPVCVMTCDHAPAQHPTAPEPRENHDQLKLNGIGL